MTWPTRILPFVTRAVATAIAPALAGAWTALGLRTEHAGTDGGALVTVWNRDPAVPETVLSLPAFAGRELAVTPVFPRSLPEWQTHWDAGTGELRIAAATGVIGARVLRLEAATNVASVSHSATRTQ